uniref:Gamma-aminobutyric acid type B receptor subunit 2 n=4 Tax=Hirondellea gigas TaxID=1518452 RepID=A0A6A7G3L5_9CRUS
MVLRQQVWCCQGLLQSKHSKYYTRVSTNHLPPASATVPGRQHHGKHISTVVPYVALLLLLLTLPVAAGQPDDTYQEYQVSKPEKCVIQNEEAQGIPRASYDEYLYIEGQKANITFATSTRPAHRLLTEIVAMLLRHTLGYVDIKIYSRDVAPHGNQSELFGSPLQESTGPQLLIDLFVWSNPAKVAHLDGYDTTSYLGYGGRVGWFFPSRIISSRVSPLDYWGSYSVRDGDAVNTFYRTKDELASLSSLLRNSSGQYYCQEDWCRDGIYTPPLCYTNKCALLFASYVATGWFLHTHIREQGLYVQVAFLGPHLNAELVNRYLELNDSRSILLYHWTPSVLLQQHEYSSVSFPDCKLSEAPSYLCYYELHRFNKYIFSKLQQYDQELYNAIDGVSLNYENLKSILDAFGDPMSHTTNMSTIACNWINNNVKTWRQWWHARKPVELTLIGIFPIHSAEPQGALKSASRGRWLNREKFIDPGNVYAYRMAVDAVNENKSILANYLLTDYTVNGACTPDLVMANFINLINMKRLKHAVGVVGPACSDTVIPLAGVTKHYNVPIISYGVEGAIFTDRIYPHFFRTIPENKIYRHVYLKLFMKMGWKRIASLTEDGQKYSEYITPLHELLEKHGLTFVMRKYLTNSELINMEGHLNFLREQRMTVIIGDFYEAVARVIMCQAYHSQMTAKQGYVWILPMWYSKEWFNLTNKSEKLDCTTEEMIEALEGHISLSYQFFGRDDQMMQEHITVGEWRKKYEEVVEGHRSSTIVKNIAESDYAGFTYDAVWSYALALDLMAKQNRSLMNNLRSEKSIQSLIKNIKSLNFNGVSGEVSFRNSNSRVTDILVWQFRGDSSYRQIATFYVDPRNTSNTSLVLDKSKLVWPGGVTPKDKLEPCMVEGFRYLLDSSCTTAIVVLCLVLFGIVAMFPLACLLIIKRNYDRKVEEMQTLWRGCNIFSKFTGWQIRRESLVLNRRLGEGQFGVIYGGECNFDGQGWVAVAVKTLKSASTIAEKLEFLSEADLMKSLQHENIVKLLGVCIDGEPIYAVMEFMLYGDLKTYLLARRNLADNNCRNDYDEVSNLRLTSMVRDIATGLNFLAEHKYVHRDLACRNCLVNVYKTVKIGDFGMTRLVYENNYYRLCRKGFLPVRWMAPESITEGVYTTMSDIWSYGVILYEVITFGAYPFQNMNNNQVLDYVSKEHKTLRPPPDIHPLLETLLIQCWLFSPSRRPTAAQVVNILNANTELVTPCLDSPQGSVEAETGNTALLQPSNPRASIRPAPTTTSLSRRLSLHPQRHQQSNGVTHSSMSALHYSRQGSISSSSSHNQGGRNSSGGSSGSGCGAAIFSSSGRKRSMSDNMVIPPITASLSDTTIGHHSTLDALNLSVSAVVVEEKSEECDNILVPADNSVQCRAIGDEMGDSSGYASTGTGTGGSNSSYKRTDNFDPGFSVAIVNPNRNVTVGCIGAKCAINSDVCTHSLQCKNRTEGCRTNTPVNNNSNNQPRILNNPNVFYLSDVDKGFENSGVSIEDEGAIPLLPQSARCSSDTRNSSNIRLVSRRRTPTPDDSSSSRECRGKNNSSSSASTITSATASNA